MATNPPVPDVSGPWKAYRTWACTSRYLKAQIDRDLERSLWLAVLGAILATLSQQIARWAPATGVLLWVFKSPGVLGSCAVAVSAYLSSQALTPGRIQAWTRARAAADSLKSLIFLYRVAAPPFDGLDPVKQLVDRAKKVVDGLGDLEPRPADDAALPAGKLQINGYIKERVDEQIGWYEKRAREHQKKADAFRGAIGWLGAVAAVLALATTAAPVSAWAGVVATITASITAHLKNQQHQTLATNYQLTALRLGLIKTEWLSNGKTDADKAEKNQFVQRCEDTMAAENGAWGALWSQKNGAAPGNPTAT